jgi:hypothetical protein
MLDDPIPVLEGVLLCGECDRPGLPGAPGWETMLTDDEPPEVMVFCPRCVDREFSAD